MPDLRWSLEEMEEFITYSNTRERSPGFTNAQLIQEQMELFRQAGWTLDEYRTAQIQRNLEPFAPQA